jgi:hypothetical protein
MTTSTSDGQLFAVTIELRRTGVTIGGTWRPNDCERRAAWDLCVELATRVPVIPLRADEGLLSEALGSLHAQFAAVREILRTHGPEVASSRPGELSLAVLAGHLVNQVLRPVVAYWHPLLTDWMDQRPPQVGRRHWEEQFEHSPDIRKLLEHDLRKELLEFTDAFAKASGGNEFVRVQIDNEDRQYSRRRRGQARMQ